MEWVGIDIRKDFKEITLLVLLIAFCIDSHSAELNVNELRQGGQLFKIKKYTQAAELWVNKSEKLIQVNRNEEQLRVAALAQVLAAIAYEKEADFNAYLTWATGQTYLLESNIRWRDFQQIIHDEYEDELNFLNQASSGQIQIGIALLESESQQSSLLLMELERELALSHYQGPEPGLYERDNSNSRLIDVETESKLAKRSYVARPAVLSNSSYDTLATATSRGFRDNTIGEQLLDSVNEILPETTDEAIAAITNTSNSELNDTADVVLSNTTNAIVEPIVQALPKEIIFSVARGAPAVIAPKPATAPDVYSKRVLGGRGLVSADLINNYRDRKTAKKAWQYFSHNVDSNTGLAYDNCVYPYSTMWGIGSYISALVSSQKLGVISIAEFNRKFDLLLNSLTRMPLFNQEVPNPQYKADTLSLIDMENNISDIGSGWSAIGIGRLLIWLKIVSNWYPSYQDDIERFVSRFDLERVLKDNELNGSFHDGFSETVFHEGRFGYEQYAAMGYKLLGHTVDNALNYDTIIFKQLYEIDIPIDSSNGAHLVSDPFLLAAMEFSLIDEDFRRYTQKIYQVQKQHSLAIKRPVAQTEINRHQTPWFACFSIFDNEKPWQVISFDGNNFPAYSGFSTHGLFMFNAVFSDKYSKEIMAEVVTLASDNFGYYSGKAYNGTVFRALSSHSNGVILQSLLFSKLNEPFLNQGIKVVQQ